MFKCSSAPAERCVDPLKLRICPEEGGGVDRVAGKGKNIRSFPFVLDVQTHCDTNHCSTVLHYKIWVVQPLNLSRVGQILAQHYAARTRK